MAAQAKAELVAAWNDMLAARAEIDARRIEIQTAEAARLGVLEEAKLGERTQLDVLDATLDVQTAKAALIEAQREEAVARFVLAALLGVLGVE